ncbi:hypothetical protein B0H14DRAFT_3130829 [Mycena olivaceomarginata]|nr:hypothetical protein B0H14DRAFT_3130829 [Mycena olivaceomarginata]
MFCRASTFTFSLVFSCLLTFFLSSCRYRWWLAGAAVCLGGALLLSHARDKTSLDYGEKWGMGVKTPISIIGGTLFAAIVAITHHFFDEHLNGRTTSELWTQTTSSRIEIVLATVFKSWYFLRRQTVTLGDLDALVGEPSPMVLHRRNLIFQMPLVIFVTIAILASPLITILAPSLNTRQAFSGPRILRVPTLNTTTDGILNDIYLRDHGYGTVTETWDKAALFSLLSAIPVGWAMPDGCSPQCEYNFTYIAPALRCSDIHSNQIDDMVGDDRYRSTPRVFEDPPSAYLMGYDGLDYQRSSLNFTVQNYASAASDHYNWTLAYLPYSASNGDLGVPINATGSQCTFYNATHIASTHFFNGTQESRVSVVEFHAPLNTTYKSPDSSGYYATALTPLDGSADSTQFLPGVGSHVHLLAIADSLSAHLEGSILIDGHSGVLLAPTTMMMETNLFVPYGSADDPMMGIRTTEHVRNVSQGFVKLSAGFTTVVATVASPDIVYVYHHTTLITTYSAAFLVLVLISATGMFSAVKNGEPSSNNFSKLLVALRNPDLEAVAAAVVRKSMDVHRARLRFDAGPQGGREAYRVFYPA